ncbi:CLUMA_CG008803, isoform A [Clunio marinus]|uniref:CLUMA_CG008803, isoform A n=1 Tax=Clunio marinus TaxID=568069 RepID=A0A1J1I4Z5_9DIPT|nr:CLUMA_CG008803, isoform A [Clunio marinus]
MAAKKRVEIISKEPRREENGHGGRQILNYQTAILFAFQLVIHSSEHLTSFPPNHTVMTALKTSYLRPKY